MLSRLMRNPEQLAINRLLSWVAAVATLIVTPWISLDPINVPKLAVISAGGFMCFAYLLLNFRTLKQNIYRAPVVVGGLFIFDLLVVLFMSGNNFNQEFFGTNGRSTGFVAYVALVGLLLAAVLITTQQTLPRFIWFLMGSGFLSVIYGLVQAMGKDPIKWVNSYGQVVGFVGNPDFESAFVALSAVMAIAMLFNRQNRNVVTVAIIGYLLLAFYVIKETKAQQGFLMFLGGASITGLTYVYTSKFKKFSIPITSVGIMASVVVVLGSLNFGPLASTLHKDSVIYRGDYWRAGWKMTLGHPFFGVGLDSYGDWYRRSRTLEATLRRGPDVTSNAAHNVLLDFSSSGGFPLLIIYLILVFLVARAAVRVIKRSSGFNPEFTGLFAVWAAYQAQSIISLNQLALAVWGWIISGIIIGYEINSRTSVEERVTRRTKKNRIIRSTFTKSVQPSTTLALFVGLLVGLLVGLPPFVASSKTKSAFESGDIKVITSAIKFFPQDSVRTNQIAIIFQQNKLDSKALAVSVQAAKMYPDSYIAWKTLSSMSNASSAQLFEAKIQMKRLDPLNPDLK